LLHDRVSCSGCREKGIATGKARLPVRSATTPRATPIGKFNATTAEEQVTAFLGDSPAQVEQPEQQALPDYRPRRRQGGPLNWR